MKTVELSAALGQAQVVENLKNFVGVDAQGAAALMTPERLAAVAGGIMGVRNFKSGALYPSTESVPSNPKSIAEYVYQNASESSSFMYIVTNGSVCQVVGYLTIEKKYGVIKIFSYLENFDATFIVKNGILEPKK